MKQINFEKLNIKVWIKHTIDLYFFKTTIDHEIFKYKSIYKKARWVHDEIRDVLESVL